MIYIFKFIGAFGVLLISAGIVNKKRKTQDLLDIAGGLCLAVYSIYVGDVIFIILEIIFTLTAFYDFLKRKGLHKN